MAYADFTFYQNSYYGNKISTQTGFIAPSERASDYIDAVTFGRAALNTDDQITVKIKKCCCALADEIQNDNLIAGKTSEKIGSYSVSYADTSNKSKKYQIALQYLGNTGIMSCCVE